MNYTSSFLQLGKTLLYWLFDYERADPIAKLLRTRGSYLRGYDPRAHGRLFRLALPVHLPRPWLRHELHRICQSGENSEPLEGTCKTTLLRRSRTTHHISNLWR